MSLLKNEEKVLAVQTFLEFGQSSITLGNSDKMIEQLMEKQYDAYRGIEKLMDNSSYVQVIEHPSIPNAQMTLADDKSDVKIYTESV